MDDAKVLRALGALLTYPSHELIDALPEIAEVLDAALAIPVSEREELAALVAEMRATDALDLEGRYVDLFDRGRATSLNLFEHRHGDSRDRGPAMVALKDLYARAGLRLATKELPDFLPVVLEYLSCRDRADAQAMLRDCAPILRSIGEALVRRGSRHAAVFASLLVLAGENGLDRRRAGEAAPAEAGFDDDWSEKPAFAPPAGVADSAGAGQSTLHFVSPRHS